MTFPLDRGTYQLYSGAVDPASIAAGAAGNTDITVLGVKKDALVIGVPPIDLEAGVVPQACSAPSDDTIRVRLVNHTASAVDGASKTWNFVVFTGHMVIPTSG